MDVAVIGDNLIFYIFGSPLFAGLALIGIIALVGIRFRFTIETYVITLVPAISLLTGMYGVSEGWIDIWIGVVMALGLGFILAMAGVVMIRR